MHEKEREVDWKYSSFWKFCVIQGSYKYITYCSLMSFAKNHLLRVAHDTKINVIHYNLNEIIERLEDVLARQSNLKDK